jgi:hypothetical protein
MRLLQSVLSCLNQAKRPQHKFITHLLGLPPVETTPRDQEEVGLARVSRREAWCAPLHKSKNPFRKVF